VRGCLGFGGLPVTSGKVLGVFRIDKKKWKITTGPEAW